MSEAFPAAIRHDLVPGIRLWLSGRAVRTAAKETGVPVSTLWDTIQRHRDELMPHRETTLERIAAQASTLAEEAGRQLLEKLLDPDEKLSAMQLMTIHGVECDKTTNAIAKATQAAPENALEGLLSKALEAGGRVTIEGAFGRTINATATLVSDVSEREKIRP
jgi:hypothetical protein